MAMDTSTNDVTVDDADNQHDGKPLSGFHDDMIYNTFGVMKKGVYRPLSDFNFEFLLKVNAQKAGSTGYLIKVFREVRHKDEGDDDEEEESLSSICYYTADSSMRRLEFMKMLNDSYPSAGLTCSMQDHQLSEYLQTKKRSAARMPEKLAVRNVGQQQDKKTWVFGPNCHIGSDGTLIDESVSPYVWISHLYTGPGVAPRDSACNIELPLTTEPLMMLMENLKDVMQHNFLPSLLVLGACAMALHYNTIIETYMHCPIPLVCGPPGTGKSTALRCGLSLLGAYPQRYWSYGTKEKYTALCSESMLPLGIDDPRSQSAISELVMSLYGAAQEGTMSRGCHRANSLAIISSNFFVKAEEKYLSRCLLIEFSLPQLDSSVSKFIALKERMGKCSSSLGYIVSLGEMFVKQGHLDIDNAISPKIKKVFGLNVSPRVQSCYCILMWFVLKLIHLSKEKESLEKDVWAHLAGVASTKTHQEIFSSSQALHGESTMDLDMFANELIQCVQGRSIYEIWSFMRINTVTSAKSRILSVRLEAVPLLTQKAINFILQMVKDETLGIKGDKRDFLATPPKDGITLSKVTRSKGGKQFRCTSIYMKSFSNETQRKLEKVTSRETSTTSETDMSIEDETLPTSKTDKNGEDLTLPTTSMSIEDETLPTSKTDKNGEDLTLPTTNMSIEDETLPTSMLL